MQEQTACACQSGNNYSACCEPFHLGNLPENAEQLMRSRYTAYTQGKIDYIVASTVPSQQALLDVPLLKTWSETTDWQGLEVVSHQELDKQHSQVAFKAFFKTEQGLEAHEELSLFVKIEGRWYFVDPTVRLPSQKQPCLCGSGKKFKHCCGTWL